MMSATTAERAVNINGSKKSGNKTTLATATVATTLVAQHLQQQQHQ
jgi:hypothetical protein